MCYEHGTLEQISIRILGLSSFWYVFRYGIAGSFDNPTLIFWGTNILFSPVAIAFYIPTNPVGGFLFLSSLQCLIYSHNGLGKPLR